MRDHHRSTATNNLTRYLFFSTSLAVALGCTGLIGPSSSVTDLAPDSTTEQATPADDPAPPDAPGPLGVSGPLDDPPDPDERFARTDLDDEALRALTVAGHLRFVAIPSVERAVQAGRTDATALLAPDRLDARQIDETAKMLSSYAKSRALQRRLRRVAADYATTLSALRQAGLPDVLAAIPYLESRYQPQLQSFACAKGYWQLMPEVVVRAHKLGGVQAQVADCTLARPGADPVRWTPTELIPPSPLREKAPYIDSSIQGIRPEACLIPPEGGCAIDDRTDLDRSNAVAVYYLSEPWNDPVLARSGAAVAATLVSFNAGYDDARFGLRKAFNVRPAFERWSADRPTEEHHKFYGESIACSRFEGTDRCGSTFFPESQFYGVTAVAIHIFAACYYGHNMADEHPIFASYQPFAREVCGAFARL